MEKDAVRADPAERPAAPALTMRVFWDERQRAPRAGGGASQRRLRALCRASRPGRLDARRARRDRGRRPTMARRRCSGSIRQPYLDFLRSAFADWRAARPAGRRLRLRLAGGRPPRRSTSTGSTPGSAHTASTPPLRSPRAPGRAPIGPRRPRLRRSMRCSQESAPPSPCAARPATMPAPTIWAAIATSTMPRSPPRRPGRPAPAGRDPRRRLSSRQRHPGHLLRARRRPLRLDPRRSAHRLSLLLGPCGRDRRGRRAKARPSTCRCRAAPGCATYERGARPGAARPSPASARTF